MLNIRRDDESHKWEYGRNILHSEGCKSAGIYATRLKIKPDTSQSTTTKLTKELPSSESSNINTVVTIIDP